MSGDAGRTSSFGSYLTANTNLNRITISFFDTNDRPSAAAIAEYRKNSIGYKIGFEPIKESTFGIGYGYGGLSSWSDSGSSNHNGAYYFYYPSEFKGTTINVTPNETISCIVGAGGRSNNFMGNNDGGGGFILIGWGGDIK